MTPSPTLLGALRWAPAVLAAAALVWAGVRRAAVALWPLAAGLLWLVPALFTAAQYSVGQRRVVDPAEIAAMFGQVFGGAAAPGQASSRLAVVALVLGGVGLAVRVGISRSVRSCPRD